MGSLQTAERIPTSSTQAKRLAVLYGPDRWWKPPLVYAIAVPVRHGVARINDAQLARALQLLTVRHTSLRFRIAPGGEIDTGLLEPACNGSWPLRVVDASGTVNSDTMLDEALHGLQKPFDPYTFPWLRATLIRRVDDDVIGLAIDHCLIDGYAARVLFADLNFVYNALGPAGPVQLATTVSDAVQFAREERAWLASADGAAALSHWDSIGAKWDAVPRLHLPTRTCAATTSAHSYDSALSPSDITRLRAGTKRMRISPFMATAAATAIGLAELTGNGDVSLLFSSTRRTWPGTAELVAYLANRLALRVAVGPADTIETLATQVRNATLESVRHGMLHHEQYLRIRFPEAYERQPSVPHLHINLMDQGPMPPFGNAPTTLLPVPPPRGGFVPPGIGINVELREFGDGAVHAFHPEHMYDTSLVAAFVRGVGDQLRAFAR